ncbi:MAG: hypothetical protein ABI051_03170 [Vicinamibacterales bacterium]
MTRHPCPRALRGSGRLGVLLALLCLVLPSAADAQNVSTPGGAPVNADASWMADFQKRLGTYLNIHETVKAKLPALPRDATPTQIDRYQRLLGQQIALARPRVKQGDLFTPGMQGVVRKILTRIFGGPTGKQLRASVMDENPVGIKFRVNQRYPDTIPLSTMPPAVLEELPKLPAELEYRFLGSSLILFDVDSHLIVDYIPNALPPA